jgi:hypothetical protein
MLFTRGNWAEAHQEGQTGQRKSSSTVRAYASVIHLTAFTSSVPRKLTMATFVLDGDLDEITIVNAGTACFIRDHILECFNVRV